MASFKQGIRKSIGRWSRQQEAALSQMTQHKTVRQRIAGFAKSERIDAKFFLLAIVPFIPLIVLDEIGWSRGLLWHGWFWFSVIWAAAVGGIGFVSYWRAFRRSLKRNQ